VSVLHVGCAVEGDYVAHSAAMLHSVLRQRGERRVRVHYLHGRELPRGSAEPLGEMVEEMGGEVTFVDVPDERCEGLPTKGFTGKATWYRTMVADLLPDIERILFLDADLIALSPLEPLWQTDVSDHYLAAVTNVFQAEHFFRAAELGMDRHQDYFNAGVMLMNLDLMRRHGCTAAMHEFGVAHADELAFRDQDALNAVLSGRRRPLHPRWNCTNALHFFPWSAYVFGNGPVEEARRAPAIRHFEGPEINKPWSYRSWSPQREVYFEHRRGTPWPEVELTDVPSLPRRLAGRLRRRLTA
jgi:lipopolysaccharide biosynthesis glycosyltransferase